MNPEITFFGSTLNDPFKCVKIISWCFASQAIQQVCSKLSTSILPNVSKKLCLTNEGKSMEKEYRKGNIGGVSKKLRDNSGNTLFD